MKTTVNEQPGWLAQATALKVGRSRWTMPAFVLLGLAVMLSLVGITFVASASSISALHATGSSWSILQRQVIWLAVGAVVMVLTTLLPYRAWWTFGILLYVFAVGTTVLTLTGVGIRRNGSARWIGSETFGFQPSELLKLGTIIMLAGLFSKVTNRRVMGSWHFISRRLLPILGLGLLPILLQPDMGTAVVIAIAAFSIVITAGMPSRPLLRGGGIGLSLAFLYAYSSSYRRDRLTAFLRPEHDVTGVGWHGHGPRQSPGWFRICA